MLKGIDIYSQLDFALHFFAFVMRHWDRLAAWLHYVFSEWLSETTSECKALGGLCKCQIEREAVPFVHAYRPSLINRVCLLECPSLFLPRSLPIPPLHSPPLPLVHLHWDHKLLKMKPCFQSVRRASQCQGLSHTPLPLKSTYVEKIVSFFSCR